MFALTSILKGCQKEWNINKWDGSQREEKDKHREAMQCGDLCDMQDPVLRREYEGPLLETVVTSRNMPPRLASFQPFTLSD